MHHFISYSSVDAQDFALKLADTLVAGPPSIPVWIDKRNIRPGDDWTREIDNAIRSCESLIFVMTSDSVEDNSVCKGEWTQALAYKKPIIPIMLRADAKLPFRLNSRHYLGFTHQQFDVGLANLREHIQWLSTNEGRLHALKDCLADAKRDLRRASGDEKNRIEKEIAELNKEIRKLEQIGEGLEIERKPPQLGDVHTRFINPPPLSAPGFFQDREVETGIISDFIKDDSHRIIYLVGRGGIGKTAIVCRLLKSLEKDLLPHDRGRLSLRGIIYLSQTGLHKIGFANIFGDLCKLLPPETARRFDQIYKDEQPVRLKMFSLLEEFQDKPVIILLDNLEDLINPETFSLIPDDLREALKALLEAPHHTVKIIVTTRIPPGDILKIHPERLQSLPLDGDLESPYAENLLRELDPDGTRGLRDAPDTVLNKIRQYTRGFPRALEHIAGSLAADRSTTLDELLSKIQNAPDQDIVCVMVGETFKRLDKNAQMVIEALAIYGRPVPPVAVDFLLQPCIKTTDSLPILKRLVNIHFVRRERDRYSLHPADRGYVLRLDPPELKAAPSAEQAIFSQQEMYKRAADYFREIRRPKEEWNTLADLEPQLSEFELRCSAHDYQTALSLVNDIDENYLIKWGHCGMVIEMRKTLIGKVMDPYMECHNNAYLGSAYVRVGDSRTVLKYCNETLEYCRAALDKSMDSQMSMDIEKISSLKAHCLSHLAITNRRRLGQISKAIEMYERSLIIHRNLKQQLKESIALKNLGVAYRYSGQLSKALDYHEQALKIQRNNSEYILEEGRSLGTQAVSFRYTGQLQKAIESSNRALKIACDKKDRQWEAYHWAELGSSYLDLGDFPTGTQYFKMALDIAQETSDKHYEAIWALRLGVKELISNNLDEAVENLKNAASLAEGFENSQFDIDFRLARAMTEVRSGRPEAAREIITPGLRTEYGLCLPDIMALDGIILLRLKEFKEAAQQFKATIEKADNLLQQSPQFYSALEAKGVASCGLALCENAKDAEYIDMAISSYRQARSIVTAPGVIKRAMFFFDECAKADEQGILSGVRAAVEGLK